MAIAAKLAGAIVLRGRIAEATEAEVVAARKMRGMGIKRVGSSLVSSFTMMAVAARQRAQAAKKRIARGAENPVFALLIALLQTVAALGDITAVTQAAPAVGLIADALGWTSLLLPLPEPLQEHFFGANSTSAPEDTFALAQDDESTISSAQEAEQEFAGGLFWACNQSSAVRLSLHSECSTQSI